MKLKFCAGLVTTNVVIWLLCLLVSATVFAAEGKNIATVSISPAPALYATEPQPLAASQCGQCHIGIFHNI